MIPKAKTMDGTEENEPFSCGNTQSSKMNVYCQSWFSLSLSFSNEQWNFFYL